jgi:aspartate aminotransferase
MALWKFGRLASIRQLLVSASTRTTSWWTHVEQGPPDAIFGLVEAFKKDPRPEKISLAIGAYRDGNNKPVVLPTVRKAEAELVSKDLDKEYAGILGYEDFQESAVTLAFGKNFSKLADKSYVAAQTVSGTGALRLAGMFLAKFWPGSKTIYLPNPSWPNHKPVFSSSGLEVKSYSYYDSSTCGLDSAGLYLDLQSLPEKSVVLFHACAHNPTGVDPKVNHWFIYPSWTKHDDTTSRWQSGKRYQEYARRGVILWWWTWLTRGLPLGIWTTTLQEFGSWQPTDTISSSASPSPRTLDSMERE